MEIKLTKLQYDLSLCFPLLRLIEEPGGCRVDVLKGGRSPVLLGSLYGDGRIELAPRGLRTVNGVHPVMSAARFWEDHSWVEICDSRDAALAEAGKRIQELERELAKAKSDRNSFDRRRRDAEALADRNALSAGRWRDLYIAACVRAESIPDGLLFRTEPRKAQEGEPNGKDQE